MNKAVGNGRTRRSAAGITVLVVVLLLAGCKEQLYTRLSEREANEIIAVLQANGLQADKAPVEEGLFSVQAERADFGPAMQLLREHGLPQSRFSSIGEVFKKDGLVTSANAERLRFMYAMSEELSKTLSQIDGVVIARVHPVLPGGDPLTDKVTPASASVFIKHTPDADLSLLAPAIKDMVSASIEGLSYDKIALTFVPAQQLTRAVLPGTAVRESGIGPPTWNGIGLTLLALLAGLLLLIGAFMVLGPQRRAGNAAGAGRSAGRTTRPDAPADMVDGAPAGWSHAWRRALRSRFRERDSAA